MAPSVARFCSILAAGCLEFSTNKHSGLLAPSGSWPTQGLGNSARKFCEYCTGPVLLAAPPTPHFREEQALSILMIP